MVESVQQLDLLFAALADATRRDILARVAEAGLSIGRLAERYRMSLAAVSKHVGVLEKAGLVSKNRRGRETVVTLVPDALGVAREHIDRYARMWHERFDKLDAILKED